MHQCLADRRALIRLNKIGALLGQKTLFIVYSFVAGVNYFVGQMENRNE